MNQANGKLRIAYLTSCRELVKEHIGESSEGGWEYRVGSLEALVRLLNGGGEFSEVFEFAVAICDDTDEEFSLAWNEAELGPRNLALIEDGVRTPVKELVRRIPSVWRFVKNDEEREIGKREYEQKIVALLRQENVDVVISDSYRCIIGRSLLDAFKGHIINVHPAILDPADPASLPGVFPTRDAYTRGKFGYIIVDDKKKFGIPDGARIKVQYEGKEREAVSVEKIAKTGVSVHYVTENVDGGPIIASASYEFDPESATEENLRQRNYALKRELLSQALLKIKDELKR